jgi:hypothetical protein
MKSIEIIGLVMKYFDKDIIVKSRERYIIYIRAIANKLCKKYTKDTLQKIGSCTNSNHATVLHSINSFDNTYKYQTEPFNVQEAFDDIEEIIKSKRIKELGVIVESKEDFIEYEKNILNLKKLNKELQEQNESLKVMIDYYKNKHNNLDDRYKNVITDLKFFTDSQIQEFHETRLKPFKRVLKSRIEPKVIVPIAGALINR